MRESFFILRKMFHVPSGLTLMTWSWHTVAFVVILGLSCVGLRAVQKLSRIGEWWGRKQYSQEHDLVSTRWADTPLHRPLFSSPNPCLKQTCSPPEVYLGCFFPLQSGELDIITKKREYTEEAHRSLPLHDCRSYSYFKFVYLKAKAEKYFLLLKCLELEILPHIYTPCST